MHRWLVLSSIASLAVAVGCKQERTVRVVGGSATTPSPAGGGSAPATPEVSCQDAARAYTNVMAHSEGNELSALHPSGGQLEVVKVALAHACDQAWPAETRACLVDATSPQALEACWKDPALGTRAGEALHQAVGEIRARWGSGAPSGAGTSAPE